MFKRDRDLWDCWWEEIPGSLEDGSCIMTKCGSSLLGESEIPQVGKGRLWSKSESLSIVIRHCVPGSSWGGMRRGGAVENPPRVGLKLPQKASPFSACAVRDAIFAKGKNT